jgi:periplasmic protein TonB
METAARHPGDPSLRPMLIWSAVFHGALAATMLVSTLISNNKGENWAGSAGGAAVTVGLVGSVPAIPLPKPDAITESRVVDESKGLYKEEPKPKPLPPAPTAEAIPEFKTEKKPTIVPSKPSKILEAPNVPPPTNAVPYGNGGAPALPYSSTFAQPGGSQGAIGMTGAGGGDFGSKYSWFVDTVRNRISSNWLQSMIDPSVRFAPRATVSFQILRDGTITNIQFIHKSGNESVDNSAVRAILSSSPVNRLPNDYSGSVVNVEFWFEFKR